MSNTHTMMTPMNPEEIVKKLRAKAEMSAKQSGFDANNYPFLCGCLIAELEMVIENLLVSQEAAIKHLKRQIQ